MTLKILNVVYDKVSFEFLFCRHYLHPEKARTLSLQKVGCLGSMLVGWGSLEVHFFLAGDGLLDFNLVRCCVAAMCGLSMMRDGKDWKLHVKLYQASV